MPRYAGKPYNKFWHILTNSNTIYCMRRADITNYLIIESDKLEKSIGEVCYKCQKDYNSYLRNKATNKEIKQ